MHRPLAFALVLLAAAASAPAASAQPLSAPSVRTADVVTWRVRADRATRGTSARLVLDAQIAPGWRLYALDSPVGIPLTLTLDPLPAGLAAGRVAQSETRKRYDPAFDADYTYFAGAARVVQQVGVAPGAAPGSHQVTGAVRYAVCDDRVCLPPTRTAFRVAVVVE